MKRLSGFLLLVGILCAPAIRGQLIISEVSAHGGLTSLEGEVTDWIELRNDGDEAIFLGDYFFHDEFSFEGAWQLPNTAIEPGERIVFLASGEDRAYLPNNWKCPVVESDSWQYLTPTQPISTDWRFPGFDAVGWSTGPGGFGYGDGDDFTVLNDADFVFLRKEFELSDVSEYGYLSLGIDYDDGFIAYLNGQEIARSESMAGLSSDAGTYANAYIEAVLYAGGQPEQWLWNANEFDAWLEGGTNVLAVQVHNFNPESSDLSIRPFLGITRKDGEFPTGANPPAWWPEFSGQCHTSFQISPGESIVLFDANGNVVDALPVHPEIGPGYTVGRLEGQGGDWCIFDLPTPGAANQGATCFVNIESPPAVTVPSGWYEDQIVVQVIAADDDQVIRYTTNGDVPTVASAEFPAAGLTIDETRSLSLKAWSSNATTLASAVQDEIYIINEFNPDIPTFSLITDEDNLWDWNTGIYVMGPNASPEYPHFGANFWEPWSRTTRMQFFDAAGILQAREVLDLEIHGGWSRAEPQRSFRLDFKGELTGNFDWPLFPDKPNSTSFNNINLRNGGQQSWATKMQDALIGRIALGTHNIAGAWEPAHVYLNGEYWGLYGAREKYDEFSIADEFGTDKNEVDLIGPFAVLNGSNTGFNAAVGDLMATPATSTGFFPLFEEHFDVENYIDYFVFQTYIQNTDWIGIAWGLNNVKVFRASPEHRWHYILYDTDAGYGFFGAGLYENFVEYARNPGYPNAHSNLFDKVLDNPIMERRFINRYADLVNTVFQEDAFNAASMVAKDQIDAGMAPHIERWNSPSSYGTWLNAIYNMNTRNANRIGTARQHLMNSFGLPNDYECTLDVFPPLAGSVRINTIVPGPLPWDGVYFESCPVDIEAIAAEGYLFQKWDINAHVQSGDMDEFERENEVALHSNDLFRARFVPCPGDGMAWIENEVGGLGVETNNIPYVDSIAWYADGTLAGYGTTWWPQFAATYQAVVFFDGCTVSTPEINSEGMGVADPNLTALLTVQPNPASEGTWIGSVGRFDVHIFNAAGQWIHSILAGNPGYVETKNWPEGMYFVRSGPMRNKFIVQH